EKRREAGRRLSRRGEIAWSALEWSRQLRTQGVDCRLSPLFQSLSLMKKRTKTNPRPSVMDRIPSHCIVSMVVSSCPQSSSD
ncbi:hypothetical protein PFISCL1PPCAC_26236, partial [Pristionchus fissidentatus]